MKSTNPGRNATFAVNNDDEDGRTSQSRRTACDVCRERKVRCDRSYPQCGRCLRLRHKCHYTPSTKSNSIDVPQALMKLDSRIAQAEARLAFGQSSIMAYPSPFIDPSSYPSLNWLETGQAMTQYPEVSYSDIPGMNLSLDPSSFGGIDVSCEMMKQTLDEFQVENDRDPDHVFHPDSLPSPDMAMSSPENIQYGSPKHSLANLMSCPIHPEWDLSIAPETLVEPHRQYFDYVHPLMPMIDRNRSIAAFEDGTSQTPEVNCLIYAIAMVGAAISKDNDDLVSACHHHARRCLEDAEREYPGVRFLSIHALQAMLLITYHEFKRQDFARGWMSLGRALRLTKLMGLHEMDMEASTYNSTAGPAFQLPLQKATSLAEIEERRRTFWVAYILDAWACNRTNSSISFGIDDIFTSLPSTAPSPEFHTVEKVIRLNEAICCDTDNPLPPVSTFAGLAIVCGLGAICNRHGRIVQKQQHRRNSSATSSPLEVEEGGKYPFWVQHFAIDKKLQVVSHFLFQQLQAQQQQQLQLTQQQQQQQPRRSNAIVPCDASILIVYLNFYAVSIYLHKIAAEQSISDAVPDSLKEETDRRCEGAAVQMASVLHQMHSKDTYNMNIMKQANSFILWSLTLAAQILSQLLDSSNPGKNQRRLHGTLEILHETMNELDDDSGSWDETITGIGEQLHKISSSWRPTSAGVLRQ
ncbi:fungal-specific transcription factor domain-containing protein [Talaromyces proteolyticus]|uniref:Fungal-specific transcription factor domain-containing protein n=1 Tax=Talaromyces proteolyticus TaxID=1131652 RepID=A0AAD4PZG3_9EURO|nr:fungal-specific transcription factor domain-containing protein [Talaromyces proteolyticus]KAH8698996.1 fungal-specific transcription factor domain-containing protein [Talaromyces proteolyticus]